MKKIIYRILIVISLLSLNGCEAYLQFLAASYFYLGMLKVFSEDPRAEDEIIGILVGEGGAILTSDGVGPVDWIERQSGTTKRLNFVKHHPETSEPKFFTVGDSGTVLFSSDKGHNWESRSIPSLNKNLYGLAYFENPFATAPALAVCGESGIVGISTDGGSSWAQHNTITTNKLNSLISYGYDHYVAVGENGTIIKGGPGGWENKSVDTSIHLYRIYEGIELAWSDLWVVGSNGKIYYSSNYGINWSPRNSGVTNDLYDIKFKSENEGMVVGAGGVVRYTTNRGLTWLSDPYFDGLTDGDIIAISAVDTNTASAIVHNATLSSSGTLILSVSTEPFTDVDDEDNLTPSEFRLEQNYPNPFNPSTTIEFSIPERSFIKLEIFNSLGEKVATLVSEELNAGNYKYEWKAGNLPSGIYYYKLTTNNYEQTKKLVLLK